MRKTACFIFIVILSCFPDLSFHGEYLMYQLSDLENVRPGPGQGLAYLNINWKFVGETLCLHKVGDYLPLVAP